MLQFVRSLIDLAGSRNRRRSADGFFLSPDRFELAATAERMRVDRNGSILSLLVITPSEAKNSPADVQDLERRMAARLRLTDTAGWLRDGRLGLLLPDTPEAGAWKVASDVCAGSQAGVDRPSCEVVTYPSDDRPGGGSDGGGPEQDDSTNDTDPQGLVGVAVADTTMRFDEGRQPHGAFERHFLQATPRWKRAIDVAGASFGLVVASPVIAVSALAIRLTSPGPIFFQQEREGLGGKRFRILKLRTMRPDAEQMKASLRARSEQDGPAFKLADDPRVTPIGRLLRKTSIDELPQLWNVLRGEMSLVGPRPLPVDESLACQAWQRRRLAVTPGLTCTWQIYGRNIVPFDDWIRMDLDYAARRSPWLDLKLVAKTGPSVVLQKGR